MLICMARYKLRYKLGATLQVTVRSRFGKNTHACAADSHIQLKKLTGSYESKRRDRKLLLRCADRRGFDSRVYLFQALQTSCHYADNVFIGNSGKRQVRIDTYETCIRTSYDEIRETMLGQTTNGCDIIASTKLENGYSY